MCKLEDYGSVFIDRQIDTKCLHDKKRKIAAVHMGGITIECLLKNIVMQYHNINNWKTELNDEEHTIYNPGHNLIQAIKKIPRLFQRVQSNPAILKMFDTVQSPVTDYISMRYVGDEMEERKYQEWYDCYIKLVQWLIKQSTNLK